MNRLAFATAWRARSDDQPSNRSLTIAVIVGFALRLFWVAINRHIPTGQFNDGAAYLALAKGFSFGELPTLSGRPSAFYASGYPLLLAPFVYLGRKTGLADPALVASLVNLAAGTITIILVALLASRWVSKVARNPAAWLMAVAPAHIYFTPTAHGETVFAPMILAMIWWLTRAADRAAAGGQPVRARTLLLFGFLVFPIALVRGPGIMLFAAPVLVLRALHMGWRQIARATALVVVGGVVGMVPNLVLNGLNAKVWTPISTQNATAFCIGHHEDGDGRFPLGPMPPRMAYDCYRYSPFDDPDLKLAPPEWTYNGVDEARWYRQATRRGIAYAAKHPVRELWLTKEKMVEAWTSEWDALPASRSYEQENWAGSATAALNWTANSWLYLVEALTIAGLALSKRCRQAIPVWGSVLLVTLSMVAGLAQPHFRHGAIPFMTIIAAGGLIELRARIGRRGVGELPTAAVSAEGPPEP